MDYKEKYEQALEFAQRFYNTSIAITKKELEDIFPELEESEGERIRKALLEHFITFNQEDNYLDGIPFSHVVAWLEAQGEQKQELLTKEKALKNSPFVEQKPAWSEEDEKIIETMCKEGDLKPSEVQWLKSLKERVLPQPKQEWSEDDERYLNNTISYLKDATEFKETAKLCIDWLKSLRPQNRWKPSDRQMKMVDKIINALSQMQLFGGRNALIDLKHDLEKLRED